MVNITTSESGDLFKQYIDNTNNTLRLLITKNCNSKCEYCFEEGIKGSTNHMLQLLYTEDFKNIILAGKNLGTNRVTISGGEPTLNFECVEGLVELCINEKIPVYLTSNATSNKIVKLARKYPSLEFRISFEASKEYYKKYRGIDEFENVIRNVKELSQLQNPIIINRVVTSLENEWEEFNKMINMIKKEGLNSPNVSLKLIPCLGNDLAGDLPINAYTNYLSQKNPELKLNIHQIKFQFFYEFKYEDVNVLIRTKGVHSPNCRCKKESICDEGLAWTRINPDGAIQPCYHIIMPDKIKHGDTIPTIEEKLRKSREFVKDLYVQNYSIKKELGL